MPLPEAELGVSLAERPTAPVVVMAGVTKVHCTGRVDHQTLTGTRHGYFGQSGTMRPRTMMSSASSTRRW